MFENHALLRVIPGRMDDVLEIFQVSIVPALTRKVGLLGLALVPDWHTSHVVVISLWRDESCALTAGAAQSCQTSANRLAAMTMVEEPLYGYTLT